VDQLRTGSRNELERDARLARTVLTELNRLEPTSLTVDDRNTVGFLRFLMGQWVKAPDYHLLSFTVTPYSTFLLTYALQNIFGVFQFTNSADAERYLSLVRNYRDFVRELATHLRDQINEGIRLAKPAVPGVRESLTRTRDASRALLGVADERLGRLE